MQAATAVDPPVDPITQQAGSTVGGVGFEVSLPSCDVQCRGWVEFVEFYKVRLWRRHMRCCVLFCKSEIETRLANVTGIEDQNAAPNLCLNHHQHSHLLGWTAVHHRKAHRRP